MNDRSVFEYWRGPDDDWAAWTKPALFAGLEPGDARKPERMEPSINAGWFTPSQTALVVDLPGRQALQTALALATRGARPIVCINATSSEREVIQMSEVKAALVQGAIRGVPFPADDAAAPAFILDARRLGVDLDIRPASFDNRWALFEGDLPKGRDLRSRGISKVIIVKKDGPLNEDLDPYIRNYLGADLAVSLREGDSDELLPVRAGRGWLSTVIGRVRRRLSLQRAPDGTFGRYVPLEGGTHG